MDACVRALTLKSFCHAGVSLYERGALMGFNVFLSRLNPRLRIIARKVKGDSKYIGQDDLVQEMQILKRKIQNPNTPADLRKSLQVDADNMLEGHLVNAAKSEANAKGNTELAEQAANYTPGARKSPELTEAIQKEKYDLAIRAAEMLSSEDKTKKKKPGEDKSIETARSILQAIAPTYETANALFSDAYKKKNKSLKEVVGGDLVTKQNVTEARRRLKAIYGDK